MLELKVPPLLLFNLFAAVILLPAEYPIRLDNEGFLIGSILVAAAMAIALSATMTFKRAKTTVNPYSFDNVNTLVTSGVFGYSRNPVLSDGTSSTRYRMYRGQGCSSCAGGYGICELFD